MNRPLRRVATACLVMFLALLAQANWDQVVKARSYRNDPRNLRVLLRTYNLERGPIVLGAAQGRLILARSVATHDTLTYLRTYPGGPSYAPVTGFASLVYGLTGIEQLENEVLAGEDGRLLVRRLSDYITGRQVAGGSAVLTLDPRAQAAAFAGLSGKVGAVVALDPRTGAVLAMASSPSYDPTTLSSHNPAAIRSAYQSLLANPLGPLLNRAVQSTYPPGSTFKLITAAAALSNGFTPSTEIPSPTVLALPQTTAALHNFGGEQCGDGRTTTLADALRISCNTAFGALGMRLGQNALRAEAEQFGLDDTTALRLPQTVATSVFPGQLDKAQTAQSAIGQFDVRVTPLQMAMVAAAIANHGDLMRPYLVQELDAPDLSQLEVTRPTLYRHAVSAAVAAELTTMMELVVTSGTGTNAQIPGVAVAGKTGTAEHGGKAPHAWFIGFAPADHPQVAVAVLIENGGNLGSEATGGRVAAPIAAAVIRAVLSR